MKVKCDYCGQLIDENLPTCPNCGGSLSTSNRVAGGQPKTIEELQKWYTDHNLPPERITRFFIGKDIKEPKAFGIYKNSNGDFVVYKNKSTGERAVRYEGADEGYAVNELYQRLKAEIADQKAHRANAPKNNVNHSSSSGGGRSGKNNRRRNSFFSNPMTITIIFVLVMVFLVLLTDDSPSNGYYKYNGNQYYHQGSSWYVYNDYSDDWSYITADDDVDDFINGKNYNDYKVYSHDGSDFEDTIWYDSGTGDDDDDWDSDSYWDDDDDDWDSWDSDDSWDSWDSGSDWDSDW